MMIAKAMLFTLIAVAASNAAKAGGIEVVTSIFPLYDWAREVGAERVTVTQLLPPGADPHTYAPRPSDVRRLTGADLFLYIDANMEPWAERLVRTAGSDSVRVLSVGAALRAGQAEQGEATHPACSDHDDHHHHHDHAHQGGLDPHVWLDPVQARSMVALIADALSDVDPDGAGLYRERAAAYQVRLDALHRRMEAALATCRHRELFFAGHFAFGHFARRYGLTHVSPYSGFAPDAAPTPRQMAEMLTRLRASGQTTLFFEAPTPSRMARMMARESGLRLTALHAAENLTREELAGGDANYLALMEKNLAALLEGLGEK